MWNNDNNQQAPSFPGAPSFPNFPSPGGFAPPPGPPPGAGYAPNYSPSYGPPSGPPPSGYGPPPGPPPSFGFPGTPQGGYTPPPPGPPPPQASRGYPGASYHNSQPAHAPPPGPPPGQGGYGSYGAPGGYGQGPPQHYTNPPSHPTTPGYGGGGPPQQHQGYQPSYGRPPPPPTGVQNYGPHMQDANHRDFQPHFAYSQCNGKKKALLIGINYFGQSGELRGCINDVQNIKKFLISQWNYKENDMVVLTDDTKNPRMQPTTANIIAAMQWLVKDARPNDALFFHYSGHGGQTKDTDGDEGDGYDEVIYPVDFESSGHIVDDMMHDIMVKPLPEGCRLTAIFDSCHSGSALDLPYIYSTEGKIKEPNLVAEAGQGLLSAVGAYARGDTGGMFKSVLGVIKTASGNQKKADKIAKATRTSPADVISFSGCKDSQTSADAQEAGQATGAMSYAFVTALSNKHEQSYQELLNNVRDILKAKYSQKPQLSSSHPINTEIMFVC